MKTNACIQGNAFFLILIGIFLLGGITVLVTRTSSTTDETGSSEKASIYASEVLKYAGSIKSAVDALRSRGCGENELSFWYDSNSDGVEDGSDNYYNATAPTDRSCHIFDPNGAGISWTAFKDSWVDSAYSAQALYKSPFITGKTCVPGLDEDINACATNDTTDDDLVLFFPFIKQDICSAINARLGVNSIPQDVGNAWTGGVPPRFTGTYANGNGLGGGVMLGLSRLCFEGGNTAPPTGSYTFYIVLLSRYN